MVKSFHNVAIIGEYTMVSLNTPICEFGWLAKDFNLLGVDGQQWNLSKAMGLNGLVIMFICNHCPYVKAILPRLVSDLGELKKIGINTIAISSNDVINYPDDSYEYMQKISRDNQFHFPYLFDETQQVAKKYSAICTPDFFGFNNLYELQYRGRFDSTGRGEPPKDNQKDLYNAMKLVVETGKGPKAQFSSIGCSIKWK
jgi:peroxiredoxin|tara:strand:+ start:24154 stop:24750 length:597 start_codon:yes stop_codon:yes gene_type:complete